MEWSLTITPQMLLSWQMGLLLFVLSIFAFFAGTLPDNPRRPMGDLLRLFAWPSFLIWLLTNAWRGLT